MLAMLITFCIGLTLFKILEHLENHDKIYNSVINLCMLMVLWLCSMDLIPIGFNTVLLVYIVGSVVNSYILKKYGKQAYINKIHDIIKMMDEIKGREESNG